MLRLSKPRTCSALLALALTTLALSGCSKPLSESECSQMLDHYVDLIVKSDRPDTPAEELRTLQKEARKQAAEDPSFRRCSSDVSRSKWECAMRAGTTDQLEQCLL